MNQKQHKRSAFSGKIGFVLSAAGASVGLGNIWRFPYLAAKYGGGIFLLIYIILAFTFGYTMIVAETALGRMTKKSPVGAFAAFGKKGGLSFGGWINAIIPILIVPYYSVIGGWVPLKTVRIWCLNCPLCSHFRGLRALQRQVLRLRRLLTAQIILLSAVKAVIANCSKNPQTLFVMKGYRLLCVTE